jgi:transposase-like protein
MHQRCWFHKLGNVLNALPKSLHGKAKADLQAIRMAPTRKQADHAFKRFINRYGAKYPEATEKLEKDRAALLAFFAFPAEPRVHLRTTNPIASTFVTMRHRTGRTRNCFTRATFLGLAFKMSEEAAKIWRRIRAPENVAELLGWAYYDDGIPVSDDPPETQEEQREAARQPPAPWSYTGFDNNSRCAQLSVIEYQEPRR